MPDENNKQNKPVLFNFEYDELPQPKGKFHDPFKARRDRQAEAKSDAEATRYQQQDQTPK